MIYRLIWRLNTWLKPLIGQCGSIQRLKRDSDVIKKGLEVCKLGGGDAVQRFHRPVPTSCI